MVAKNSLMEVTDMDVQDYGAFHSGYDKRALPGGSYEKNGKSVKEEGKAEDFLKNLVCSEEKRCHGRNGNRETMTEEEKYEEKLRRMDEELKQIRQQNKREQVRIQEERIRKRKTQRKLWEKLALKKQLARQDEIEQMNEKISLKRALGEDVYIEKPPLRKSLTLAEIRAICSEN